MNKTFRSFLILIIVFTLSCASTKSSKEQFAGINEKLVSRDYQGALMQIEAAKDKFYKEKEKALYYVDAGMLHHYQGNFEQSNTLLSKAETAFDELFTKSIGRGAASMLLNDNVLEYSGEDYEDVYLNVFKALNYVELDEFDDAFVEIRKINEKLALLEQKHKKMAKQFNTSKEKKKDFETGTNKFHNSALGRYLSMLLYRAEGKLDDARIDKDKIDEAWQLQSHIYNFSKPTLNNYLNKTDKAKINVISFTGRAPDKKANTLYIHTEKDLVVIGTTKENPRGKQNLETLDLIPWKDMKKGYHFKFQLPFMKTRKSNIGRIEVFIDGNKAADLQQIEDIEKVALETFKIKEPIIYLKTITRTVIKGLFSAKRKEEMENKIDNALLGFAARLATDAIVDATENADLRISRFFPAKTSITEIEVTKGIYNIKVRYYSKNGSVLFVDDLGDKNISKSGLNLFESFYLN
ncbi:MAG: hypothetical protein PF570_03365 [Candidatus Cloacimonetes bacterium]|jgi:hypothetical protein|nr:hypothetical protein [Candidatus Cloacimonadota bacterium]